MNVVDRHIQRYVDTVLSLRNATVEYFRWKAAAGGGLMVARLRFLG